jgi:hypothetical protein
MRLSGVPAILLLLSPALSFGQDTYKVEAIKSGPPSEVAAAIKGELGATGYRVVKGDKPFAEFWLRKAAPASAKPSGPNGTIQFPVFKEGELLGAVRYLVEGQDYRDQAIAVGVYTFRYGLQPVNGAHLGVSPFRDYALLLPASKDTSTADLARKGLEEKSAEAAGTSHPAVLMLLTAPDPTKNEPSIVRDEGKDTWGAVVPLSLAVKGSTDPVPLPIQLIVSGAAAP